MAFTSKTTATRNWDEVNYEKGRIGMFYEGTYTNKEGQITPFSVITVGEEMVESLLRDIQQFTEGKLSLFLNEDKKGRKFLSFKVDEAFKKEITKK